MDGKMNNPRFLLSAITWQQSLVGEIVDRVIGDYVTTLSRAEGIILEKTYNSQFNCIGNTSVPQENIRHDELNKKLLGVKL